MDQFAHETKRFARFEPGQVTTANTDGTYNLNTGDRPADRTDAGCASGIQLNSGSRALMISAGDGDQPVIIGQNPWICQ